MKLVNEHLKQLNITTIGSDVYRLVVTLCVNDNNYYKTFVLIIIV